jgi:hypothetical protein
MKFLIRCKIKTPDPLNEESGVMLVRALSIYSAL